MVYMNSEENCCNAYETAKSKIMNQQYDFKHVEMLDELYNT